MNETASSDVSFFWCQLDHMVDASQLLFRVNIPIRNIFHQKWNVNCICLVVVYHVDLSMHRDI